MTSEQIPRLRERTRRAVQAELTDVAQDLFVTNGYENTTVDAIATAAGLSKRSFFRYFASKEDLVIGKYELFGDRLTRALADRPDSEPVWESLRHVLYLMVDYVDNDESRHRAETMLQILELSPQLKARYLEKQARWQSLLAAGVRDRLSAQTDVVVHDDPRPAAIVGASFACFEAAQSAWLTSDRSSRFVDILDQSMGALRPN